MKYHSICCMCGRETPKFEGLMEHAYAKQKAGFIELDLKYGTPEGGFKLRSLNFCPSCSNKSYTIEELKITGNYNQWSY